jgi:hypothetical protein
MMTGASRSGSVEPATRSHVMNQVLSRAPVDSSWARMAGWMPASTGIA